MNRIVKKIVINGREIMDYDNLPMMLKNLLKDDNENNVPDSVEQLVEETETVKITQKPLDSGRNNQETVLRILLRVGLALLAIWLWGIWSQ